MPDNPSRSRRGFASMDPQRQREIARAGGRAAHQEGTAHEFTPDEARAAGRKGGQAVSSNREHMSRIGRKGGEASHGRRRARREAEVAAARTAPAPPVGYRDDAAAQQPDLQGPGQAPQPETVNQAMEQGEQAEPSTRPPEAEGREDEQAPD